MLFLVSCQNLIGLCFLCPQKIYDGDCVLLRPFSDGSWAGSDQREFGSRPGPREPDFWVYRWPHRSTRWTGMEHCQVTVHIWCIVLVLDYSDQIVWPSNTVCKHFWLFEAHDSKTFWMDVRHIPERNWSDSLNAVLQLCSRPCCFVMKMNKWLTCIQIDPFIFFIVFTPWQGDHDDSFIKVKL